ncbi:MAG TPA: kelch repeat-containing protein [Puia sp.]|nr:kelch repeat-containing protein [Puia sp.]
MNRNSTLSLLLISPILFNSCKHDACCGIPAAIADGTWIAQPGMPAEGRSESVAFVIGNYVYVGTGVDSNFTRLNDFWRFDPSNNTWSQQVNLAGIARNSAVGFSVNGEGYIATGYDGYNMLSDCWQFDPNANAWTQKAAFIGTARYDAVAFSIGNYGYIGTGYDGSYQKDFYRYDPSSDSWSATISYPGYTRTQAIAFVYYDSAYVVTGSSSGSVVNDFWRFDPNLDDASQWRQLRNITNSSPGTYDDGYTTIERSNGVGFVLKNTKIGDRAFIATGINGALMNQTWAYNFATDLWNEMTSLPANRQGAIGFSVSGRGFVGLGLSGNTPLSDLTEFQP